MLKYSLIPLLIFSSLTIERVAKPLVLQLAGGSKLRPTEDRLVRRGTKAANAALELSPHLAGLKDFGVTSCKSTNCTGIAEDGERSGAAVRWGFSITSMGQSQTASQPATRPQAQRATPKPQAKKPAARPQPQKPKLPDFSANPDVAKFIAHMAEAHQFDDKELAEQFAKISPNQRVLTLFRPPKAPQTPQAARPEDRSWNSYRARFINKSRIEGGLAFWQQNKETLNRAYEIYGVPPEAIVAIIGVETLYGRQTGGFVVMEALASLAFHDPGRGDFFRSELEHFLLLSRENGFDFLRPQGSYAGAIGIPQFMPGSWRKYAVDFDGDGVIDLERSVNDAIGSVANYLKEHGWEKDEALAHKIKISGAPKAAWLEAGMLPSLKVEELAKNGVHVDPNWPSTATLISLPTPQQPTEYWLGFKNYYAITRYNRSTFYAMSVVQLAEELKAKFFTATK